MTYRQVSEIRRFTDSRLVKVSNVLIAKPSGINIQIIFVLYPKCNHDVGSRSSLQFRLRQRHAVD